MKKCKHPPERLYSWFVNDVLGTWLCIGCCDCGYSWVKEFKKGGNDGKEI